MDWTEQNPAVVIHGHFYQPPRESPWTGRIPEEPSAHPYHDWNLRILDECYRPITAASVLDSQGRLVHLVNTLEWISFDVGPTLLQWLAREDPTVYGAIIEADRRSVRRLGHGNALATPYHHVILPLASRRDKVTEVRWGIADFRRRFGREPEGMWLPEAAVDMETLEVLAEAGIRFTILGPGQVERPPPGGAPGRVDLGGGKSMAVVVYDGGLSHDAAFGKLLKDGCAWAERMSAVETGRRLHTLATDGETFGHHHRWGDMALAGALAALAEPRGGRLTNAAAFLARYPATEPIEIVEPSSWSCAHGVERWRSDCGCRAGSGKGDQDWRAPLREGLEELADAIHRRFEEEGAALFEDPWSARDRFGETVEADPAVKLGFVAELLGGREGSRDPEEASTAERALGLLEMERDALRMFTSCGWFFDDVVGLEPRQNLRYAAHALKSYGDGRAAVEARLLDHLGEARAPKDGGTAIDMWNELSRPPPAASVTTSSPPGPGRVETAAARTVRRALEDVSPEAAAVEAAQGLLERGGAALLEARRAVAEWLECVGPSERESLTPVLDALGFAREAGERPLRARPPLPFVFGLHLHQPVGNFDSVFEEHTDEVYAPLLAAFEERDALPIALHVSGPLLDWWERRAHPLLNRIGSMASRGDVEILLSGMWEPVLPALSPEDRLEQIGWMRDKVRSLFGVEPGGLWLTERVWEPGLAADLVDADIDYLFIDDRHLAVTGLENEALRRPWRTEAEGRSLTLLPIDERLRYLVPFRPSSEFADHIRRARARGEAMAVLADDGEKFGGWPGTRDWVWESGWLTNWFDTLDELRAEGDIVLSTPSRAIADCDSAGLAYVPSASYREMEGWSLPPESARRLEEAREGPEQAHIHLRGGHWRNFLARYPESNRMHKKAALLSTMSRQPSAPEAARVAVGRAQCNDVYWHGVFGGTYLKHLRDAVWANLAAAESLLRKDEPLRAEVLDFDEDGHEEIWVHSGRVSVVVSPRRGGQVEELSVLDRRVNLASVMTRRREAYHRGMEAERVEAETPDRRSENESGLPSIHDIEADLGFERLPPFDRHDRTMLTARVLPEDAEAEPYEGGEVRPLADWSTNAMRWKIDEGEGVVVVTMAGGGSTPLETEIRIVDPKLVRVTWRWDSTAFPEGALFAPELSLAHPAELSFVPDPARVWEHDIRTVSRSEAGSEESVQGRSTTPLWPIALGTASLVLKG